MLSMNRKSFVAMLSVGTILTVVASLCITVNAEEKTNKSSAQNAVAVPQGANLTPAQKFFENMSPEEFRDPVAMDDFISRFPDSPEARAVFAIRFSLLEKFPTIEGYNDFIQKYPDKLQTQIAIQEVFKLYHNQNRVSGYYDFIQRYPNTEQSLVAMLYIQEIMYQYACQLDTEEEYDAFIEAFPDAPQVEAARDKAKDRAIEKEQIKREGLVKNNANLDIQVRMMVNGWNTEINKFEGLYPDPESKKMTQDDRLALYKIYRTAQVLQDVYKDIAATEPIQGSLQRFSISQRLNKIEEVIKESNDKLLVELNNVSNKITKQLGEIAKNQEEILKQINQGFEKLHNDLSIIHKELKNINRSIKDTNEQLERLNSHFDAISILLQTLNPCPSTVIISLLEKLNNCTKSFEPDVIEGIPFDFVDYRKRATRPLNNIALCGFNTIDSNLFSHLKVGSIIENMQEKWRSFRTSNTTIGKFLGKIVEKTLEFIPALGPYIATNAGEATEYYVDEVFIPYIKQIGSNVKEKAEICQEILKEYKKQLYEVAIEIANYKLSPEAIEKLKKFINSFNETVDNFKDLVKQVAEDLSITPEALLYKTYYIN